MVHRNRFGFLDALKTPVNWREHAADRGTTSEASAAMSLIVQSMGVFAQQCDATAQAASLKSSSSLGISAGISERASTASRWSVASDLSSDFAIRHGMMVAPTVSGDFKD